MKTVLFFIIFISLFATVPVCSQVAVLPTHTHTIHGMVMGIAEGSVYLLQAMTNDTLAKATVEHHAFELYLDPEKKYTGIGLLSMIRSDKKKRSSAMIFVEPANTYFFMDTKNQVFYAGTDNQQQVNQLVQNVVQLEKQFDIDPTPDAVDSAKLAVTNTLNQFLRISNRTDLHDYALLLTADLLMRDRLVTQHLTQADTICQQTNMSATVSLFCDSYLNAQKPLIGTPLPAIRLKDTTDHYLDFAMERDHSKYLVIDFWASWCGPCLKKWQELQPYFARHQHDIQVLTVSGDQSVDKWKAKLAQLNLPYIHLYDPQKQLHKQLKVSSIPHIIVVDKTDTIIAINPTDWNSIIK